MNSDLLPIMEKLGGMEARIENIEKAVSGNGMPGLAQKVEDLQEKQNKVAGAVTVLGGIGAVVWGVLEWAFHFRGH